jgi:hypothetical protein
MLRAVCLTMVLGALPGGRALADTPAGPGANAALKYWQGFATLPRLTDAEQNRLGEPLTVPLDKPVRDTLTRARYALDMMNRAAALPKCDWGIGYEEGVGTLLPYAPAARLTANLACLRARLRFEEGHGAEAVDDLVAALSLGRRVSIDGINILLLTSYAIEHRTGETLARYLPTLDAAAVKAVQKRLAALPAVESSAVALQFEEQFALDWLVRTIKEAKDRDSLLTLLGKLADSPEKGRAIFDRCGGTAEGVLKLAEQTRQSYARMRKSLGLPLEQFAKAWDDEVKKQADNEVFHWIFPAEHKVRLLQLRADVRRALLTAALAVRLEGPDVLRNHPDPAVGGPFEYVAFPGGFELRSKWKLDEGLRKRWKLDDAIAKPLVLTVGRRER